MSPSCIEMIVVTQGSGVSASFVGEPQALCRRFLKKWVGLPRSANPDILLIGCRQRFGMRLHHLSTGWKKCQGTKWHILHTSRDAHMRILYQDRRAGDEKLTRKYAVKVELECAEATAPKTTDNEVPSARAGVGLPSSRKYSAAPRKALLKVYDDINVEAQVKKFKELQMQGRWLEWTDVMVQDLSWSSLLHGGNGRDLKFLLASTMNVLPTPDNLRR